MQPLIVGVVALAGAAWAVAWAPAGRRTRKIEIRTTIERDVESVFDFLADMRNFSRFWPGVDAVEKVSDGPIGAGTRFNVGLRVVNARLLERDEIVLLDRPRLVKWRSIGPLQATETFELAGDDRRTTLTYRFEAVEPYANALLGMALFAPLLNRLRIRDRRAAWIRLKRVLETRGGA